MMMSWDSARCHVSNPKFGLRSVIAAARDAEFWATMYCAAGDYRRHYLEDDVGKASYPSI